VNAWWKMDSRADLLRAATSDQLRKLLTYASLYSVPLIHIDEEGLFFVFFCFFFFFFFFFFFVIVIIIFIIIIIIIFYFFVLNFLFFLFSL
jgi:hypothetical protein